MIYPFNDRLLPNQRSAGSFCLSIADLLPGIEKKGKANNPIPFIMPKG